MKNPNDNFGDLYSLVYDELNKYKNYELEFQFAINNFFKYSTKDNLESVLDLGCGSGRHLEFCPPTVGRAVGVDISEEMISQAIGRTNKSFIEFKKSSIAQFLPDQTFDLVFSLFHVLSYQTKLEETNDFFKTLRRSLSPDGIAVVDFWHRPAWTADPPTKRITKVNNEIFTIQRISDPKIDELHGLVDIEMELEILHNSGEKSVFKELHKLRAFTLFEIELLANLNNLKVLEFGDGKSLEGKSISETSWYGFVVLRKSHDT